MKTFAKVCAVILGVLMVAMGIWMCATPAASLVGLVIFMSIAVLIYGIYEIYLFCVKTTRSGWVLAGGILSSLLGLWMLFSRNAQEAMLIILPFVFAIWLLMSGVNRTVGSFTLKDLGSKNWGWVLALGILGIIAGFLLMFTPVVSALTLSIAVGLSFMFQGIAVACLAFVDSADS